MKDDFELYLEADKEKEEYKKLYFEELKRANELQQELKDTQKSLSCLKSTIWLTLYTIMCIFLTYTYTSIPDTLFKLLAYFLLVAFVYAASMFVSTFFLADNNNFSPKGKVLTIIGVLIIIPLLTYLTMNMPPVD